LQLVASLERSSEHPLAAANVSGAEARNVALSSVQEFSSITGKGVKGTIAGKQIAVGNAELFRELSIDPAPLLERAEAIRKEGQTVMLVAVDGKAAGLVSVFDSIKESTPQAIGELKPADLKIIMVTGDNATTARRWQTNLASSLKRTFFRRKKAEVVKAHQQGQIVAMAGDGVNDAPEISRSKQRFMARLGNRKSSNGLYEKSADLLDGLIGKAPTPAVERQLLSDLSMVYAGYFASLTNRCFSRDRAGTRKSGS
jgi:P-type Cu+ transporter